MTDKSENPRGRPITNKVDQISATPEEIAKAIFRAADKKAKSAEPEKKRKPN